jgi:bla regulator protein BlaR1
MMTSLNDAVSRAVPMIADHIWQSSIFAVTAAALMLSLRKTPARVRYGIWLTASLKFLIPFALLIRLGQMIGPHRVSTPQTGFYSAVQGISQPFAQPAAHAALGALNKADLFPAVTYLVATVWAMGATGVAILWWIRWRRIARAKLAAVPVTGGREVALLRRLEPVAGVRPVKLLLSQNPLEPGIFGIARPVLLWPLGISEELQDAHISAILAHELWHVRRRDNLTAALHMLVETIFWFHPVVWWLGSRLIDERERACDEGVLELGSEPEIYAESILKACKFCVASPLPCVAGVNGSNLKKRIVRIMSQQNTNQLSLGRKLVLASFAAAATMGPFLLGMTNSSPARAQSTQLVTAQMAVHISSLKRSHSDHQMTLMQPTASGFSITNMTVRTLIETAYHVKDYELSGGPSWIDSDRYDITYTLGESPSLPQGPMSPEALQAILAQDFHLRLKKEAREMPTYALVVNGSGPTLTRSVNLPKTPGTNEPLISVRVMVKNGEGQLSMTGGSTTGLADVLSAQAGKQVFDKTGLTGSYDIMLHWTTGAGAADSISAALTQQLGLRLEPQQAPVESFVVESVDVPAEI